MTLVHDPSELDGALDAAFRHDTLALVETYVAGARDLEVAIIGDGRGALELYGPGEIVSGHEFYDYEAKYTAGLSETSTHAEVSDRERATLAEDRARRVPGDRWRRVRARRLPGGRRDDPAVRDQHDPRLHADQPLPDDAGRWRLHVRWRVQQGRRARPRAARGTGRPPADARGPAPVSGRPVARRTRAPLPGRRTRSVRRASAGLSAVRAGAALAMLASAAAIYGVGASSAFDYARLQVDGLQFTDAAAVEAALADVRGENLFGLSTGPLEATLETLSTVESRPGRRFAAGDPRGHPRGAPAGPHLAGRGAPLPGRFGRCPVRAARGGSAGRCGRAPGHRRSPGGLGRPVGRPPGSTRSISTRRPGSPRSSRPTSGARPSRWRSSSPTRTASSSRPGRRAGRRSSASTRRACARPSSSPARSGSCAACSTGREPLVDRVILASETDGTYTPRGSPSAAPSKAP